MSARSVSLEYSLGRISEPVSIAVMHVVAEIIVGGHPLSENGSEQGG